MTVATARPPLAIPAIPTISCINIRPCTATAWPLPADVVSRERIFRPPPVTVRTSSNRPAAVEIFRP